MGHALMENRNGLVVGESATRHAGHEVSQCCRKRIEEVFGWVKVPAG